MVRIRQKWIGEKGEIKYNIGVGIMLNNRQLFSVRSNIQRLNNYWKQDITQISSCLYKNKNGIIFDGFINQDNILIDNEWSMLVNLGEKCK